MAERFDLDAIEADDALLDLLAAGGESAWEAGEHDPALKLLADLRLAVEVEDELPVETIDDPESFLARCAALNPAMDPFARKMAARGLALGVAAVAALSVSGVAAAVTGDPLSPYEKVIEKVVDGLRPQTSYPKEQLDGLGLPVADRTKIVKVAKNYQEQQQAIKDATDARDKTNPLGIGGDADVKGVLMPPLARPTPPQSEKPTTVQVPVPPPDQPTQTTDKPVDPPPSEPTSGPTDPPAPPPSDPPPTDPTTPPPTDTPTPSDPPTEPGSTDNGTPNGATGEDPAPVEQPPTVPSDSTGDGQTAGTETGVPAGETATGETATGETATGDTATGDTATGGGAPAGDAPTQPADQSAADPSSAEQPAADPPAGEQPAGEQTLSEFVPVLPAPADEPPKRLEEYCGKATESSAKHSSGKVALGWAKEAGKYAPGKHSSGKYAEGKHAAVTRAHGSMSPVTLRQILQVLNQPTSGY